MSYKIRFTLNTDSPYTVRMFFIFLAKHNVRVISNKEVKNINYFILESEDAVFAIFTDGEFNSEVYLDYLNGSFSGLE